MIEFTVSHTPESLRCIYTAWWKRRFGRLRWIAISLSVIAFIVMFSKQAMPWFAVIVATLAVTYAAFLDVVRQTAIRHASAYLDLLGNNPLRFRFTEDFLVEESANSKIEMRWSNFDSIELVGDALLLRRKPRDAEQFIAFPLTALPAEARQFLEARFPSR